MTYLSALADYQQCTERLSAWLRSSNENIHRALHTPDEQRVDWIAKVGSQAFVSDERKRSDRALFSSSCLFVLGSSSRKKCPVHGLTHFLFIIEDKLVPFSPPLSLSLRSFGVESR